MSLFFLLRISLSTDNNNSELQPLYLATMSSYQKGSVVIKLYSTRVLKIHFLQMGVKRSGDSR